MKDDTIRDILMAFALIVMGLVLTVAGGLVMLVLALVIKAIMLLIQ